MAEWYMEQKMKNTISFCLAFIVASCILLFSAYLVYRVHGSYLSYPKLYHGLSITPVDGDGYMVSSNGDNKIYITKDGDSFVAQIVNGSKTPVTYRFDSNGEVLVLGDNWKYTSQAGKVEMIDK